MEEILEPNKYFTKKHVAFLNIFTNIYYEPEIFEKTYSIEQSCKKHLIKQYIMFIGLTESHLFKCMDYLEEVIYCNYDWLDETTKNSLIEIFVNVQSATLRKSLLKLAAGQDRISSNCFMVKIEICNDFFQMDIIEHGEDFDYFKYEEKRSRLNTKLNEDLSYISDFDKLSDVPATLFINKHGELRIKKSYGLGMNFIEESSKGDYYITTVHFLAKDDYCKIHKFRIEKDSPANISE